MGRGDQEYQGDQGDQGDQQYQEDQEDQGDSTGLCVGWKERTHERNVRPTHERTINGEVLTAVIAQCLLSVRLFYIHFQASGGLRVSVCVFGVYVSSHIKRQRYCRERDVK